MIRCVCKWWSDHRRETNYHLSPHMVTFFFLQWELLRSTPPLSSTPHSVVNCSRRCAPATSFNSHNSPVWLIRNERSSYFTEVMHPESSREEIHTWSNWLRHPRPSQWIPTSLNVTHLQGHASCSCCFLKKIYTSASTVCQLFKVRAPALRIELFPKESTQQKLDYLWTVRPLR